MSQRVSELLTDRAKNFGLILDDISIVSFCLLREQSLSPKMFQGYSFQCDCLVFLCFTNFLFKYYVYIIIIIIIVNFFCLHEK